MSDLTANQNVPATPRQSISFAELISFAIPTVGAGYMFCLVSLYLMKFATDVLLIAPAVMGFIFGVSRFWDAVSDPLVGYLSDKTQTRLGRRRPWIFASIIPVGLSFWMLSAPPEGLSDNLLVAWMAVAVIGFYSAQTMFVVPHMSLGAELTDDYHERNKIFGARHAGWIAGYISALVTMYWLILAESESSEAVRTLAADQSTYAAVVTGIMLLICVVFVRERPEFAGRGAENPFKALRDILHNRHASLLIFIIFIENLGGAVITILTLYNAEYVLNAPQMAPFFILSYMVFSFLLTPIWMPIAKRIGKKHLWFFSMLVTAFAFGAMAFLQEGDDIILLCWPPLPELQAVAAAPSTLPLNPTLSTMTNCKRVSARKVLISPPGILSRNQPMALCSWSRVLRFHGLALCPRSSKASWWSTHCASFMPVCHSLPIFSVPYCSCGSASMKPNTPKSLPNWNAKADVKDGFRPHSAASFSASAC